MLNALLDLTDVLILFYHTGAATFAFFPTGHQVKRWK